MKRIVALALAASILGLSTNSRAVEITTITYNLVGAAGPSVENILSPLVASKNFTAGSMTLQFIDGITNSTVDVSATINMLSLFMQINPNNLAFVYGALTLIQTQPAFGGHLGAGNIGLGAFAGSTPGQGVQTGFVHCLGTASACLTQAGGLPNSVAIGIGANSVPFPITIPNLGPQGTVLPTANPIFFNANLSTFNARRPFVNSLAIGSFQLVGTEITRTKISTPEPGMFSMLVLGALGLAGSVAWTRRRAR